MRWHRQVIYNCNERKIFVNAVQSEIMLKIVTGSQRTRNAPIRGIWGDPLWGLRMLIKYNSYGQFIGLLSNEHHGYTKHCCLWIWLIRCPLCALLTTILQLFDIIFALSAMYLMYVDWDPLRLGRLAFSVGWHKMYHSETCADLQGKSDKTITA